MPVIAGTSFTGEINLWSLQNMSKEEQSKMAELSEQAQYEADYGKKKPVDSSNIAS